ncbi:hypothetical protein AYL99_11249 [Fonsecaea erecta]|uniref:Asl1-like glycosyl hydrolase catalytic domain-containing protein n=1 Tax=Fonsecaea erecta TaxID=1367422 RepID=A0A178Z5K6_9EURO|nr:hypothetical protein AYL99_11249 [Fonsecaea erecta]OAP54801.1 hypothetical protein AYL99_11249 [Fonsecaea erecta]
MRLSSCQPVTTLSAALLLLLSLFVPLSCASATNSTSTSTSPKRGLCYIATFHSAADSHIFTAPKSPLTWYYNYSPWPGPSSSMSQWSTEFVPMVHSASDAAVSVNTIKSILNGSAGIPIANPIGKPGAGRNRITHILTFNEPDGDTSSGGSNATPEHAAQVYVDTILPLRQAPWHLEVSLPATTGSPQGLDWLRSFNASCFKLQPAGGCAFDFIAAHWYGDFAGMASWLGTLHGMYPSKPIWVTEFAIPKASAAATRAFFNQSLPYLDGQGSVARYAWFGAFRSGGDANEWTGDAVSLFDGNGKLTYLGAEYLGGEKNGFHQGERASSNAGFSAIKHKPWSSIWPSLAFSFATTIGWLV